MNNQWLKATVTDISFAQYVPPHKGRALHRGRFHHGLVFNDAGAERRYEFFDGTVLRTTGHSLFYLPKGSDYRVVRGDKTASGCYAINFDADISDEPFVIQPQNASEVLSLFKRAERDYTAPNGLITARAVVYELINLIYRQSASNQAVHTAANLISPAMEAIELCFTDGELSVCYLANLCSVSEVYFRRLFREATGCSPKEYIIKKRIDYAKSLLKSAHYSVSEVARLCGYDEPCHFSREFRRIVGTPPSLY